MAKQQMQLAHLKTCLVGGNSNNFGNFTPNPGEMIQFDEHIFQMGWFNHQPVVGLILDWFYLPSIAPWDSEDVTVIYFRKDQLLEDICFCKSTWNIWTWIIYR